MGWRGDLIKTILLELETITELKTIKVISMDIMEGWSKGKIPRSPFALLHYRGFTHTPLGEGVERLINFGVLFGVNAVRGEEAALIGENAPITMQTMEALLEKFEDHFYGLDLGTGHAAIVGDEEFQGLENGVLVYSDELIIKAKFEIK